MEKASWKPIRKGNIYCSSSCGGRCTYAAFKKATKQAKNLAKIMGNGFKHNVWENLGWHYNIISKCKMLTIHQYSDIYFTAYLNSVPNHGGRWVSSGITPQLAMKKVLALAQNEVIDINKMLSGFNKH